MSMTPLTFAGCFGWLHEAAPGPLGVVMCASWEYEASATHQSWRVLADRLAEAGLPTLRYDYPGCGDSLGASDGPGAFDAMVKSIASARDALRERAGVGRVALVGLRLGAAMALLAAENLDVEAIALIRPIARGKGYVAEQRALARLVQTREAPAVRRDADPGALEVEGFRLSPESLDRIANIDLAASERPAPGRVLILGEPGSKQYDKLREKLVARGAVVERIDLAEVSGWAPAPVPTPPPLADCDALAGWLNAAPASKGDTGLGPNAREETGFGIPRGGGFPAAVVGTPSQPGGRHSSCFSFEEPILATATFRETAMLFGRDRGLAGVLCRPNAMRSEVAGRAAIFLNTGANGHIGAGRASVLQARGLAERGIASLRMDIAGIGDSAWTLEGPLSAIHRAERSSDVGEAIDALRPLGYTQIALVGICSGAFLAFQAALADARVDGVLLANPQFWLPPAPDKLADPMNGAYGPTSAYVAKVFKLTTWRRALRGEFELATLRGIAGALSTRLAGQALASLHRVKPKAFQRASGQGKLVALSRQLAARGCRVRLLLSEGDPARETLAALLPGGDFSALDRLMRIEAMEGADHAFVMRRTREEFLARLCDFVDAPRSASALREKAA